MEEREAKERLAALRRRTREALVEGFSRVSELEAPVRSRDEVDAFVAGEIERYRGRAVEFED